MSEIEQLKAELERWQQSSAKWQQSAWRNLNAVAKLERVKADCAKWEEADRINAENHHDACLSADEYRIDLRKAEAACSAFRAELEKHKDCVVKTTDAGKGYVPVEKVKPLAEALNDIYLFTHEKETTRETARKALAIARELGI